MTMVWQLMWHGSVVNSRSRGSTRAGMVPFTHINSYVTALSKLFTQMCFCYQAL